MKWTCVYCLASNCSRLLDHRTWGSALYLLCPWFYMCVSWYFPFQLSSKLLKVMLILHHKYRTTDIWFAWSKNNNCEIASIFILRFATVKWCWIFLFSSVVYTNGIRFFNKYIVFYRMQFFSIAKAYRTTIITHLDAAGHLSDTEQSEDGSR